MENSKLYTLKNELKIFQLYLRTSKELKNTIITYAVICSLIIIAIVYFALVAYTDVFIDFTTLSNSEYIMTRYFGCLFFVLLIAFSHCTTYFYILRYNNNILNKNNKNSE